MKIDCLKIIEDVRKTYDLTETAKLAVVMVGKNPESALYVNSKRSEARKWNVDIEVLELPESISTNELVGVIFNLNARSDIDGIIVQLPLPEHIDEQLILNIILDTKNVDGFKQGGKNSLYFEPCTPKGIIMLLKKLTNIEGKLVTLLGRGKTVGEPLRDMLIDKNATVAVCHSKTSIDDMEHLLEISDIVISAVGKPNLFYICDIPQNCIVIDAGISRVDGKQVGDFSHEYFDMFSNDYIMYTPWTNGVGKMTVAALMMNVRKAYEMRKGKYGLVN